MKEMQDRINMLEKKLTRLEILSYIGLALALVKISGIKQLNDDGKNDKPKTTTRTDSRN